MKTKEELDELKEEAENESRKPHELTEEELAQVSGGIMTTIPIATGVILCDAKGNFDSVR